MRINNIITRENPFFQASPDYMVMDDVIPESYQDWLLSCTRNDTLLWNIKHHAISDRFMDDPRNGYCAFHYLYEMDERGELSPLCNAFMPLALTFRDKLKCECLMRMRVNNTPIYPNQQVQLPHVDCYVQNSWVVIYYIDDTDGDTIIYNERTQDPKGYVDLVIRDQWSEMTRVSPKKGRAVAFKGDLFHSSTLPTKSQRTVLNINLAEQPPTANDIIYNPNK